MMKFHFPAAKEPAPSTTVRDVQKWYDRRSKSWVVQKLDARGNQIGEAEYCGSAAAATAAYDRARKEIAQ